MWSAIAIFVVSALLVASAGVFLTYFADGISEVTRLGRTLAGFLLVAGATSLPELSVDCSAAAIDAPDIAVGDLLGSSLLNLAILGFVDQFHRAPHRILSPMSMGHVLSAITSILLTGMACIFLVLAIPMQIGHVGIGPLCIAATYFLAMRLIFWDQRASAMTPIENDMVAERRLPPSMYFVGYAVAAAVILLSGNLLATSADQLADQTGLAESFVGTTLVALSTSLPECVTTLTAVRIGAFDMAVGNIFGSNCFNAAMFCIVDAFYLPGPILSIASSAHITTALSVVIVSCVALMGVLYRAQKRLWLIEPDGALVVLLCFGALWLAYAQGT